MTHKEILTMLIWLRRIDAKLVTITVAQLFRTSWLEYHKKNTFTQNDLDKIAVDLRTMEKYDAVPYYVIFFIHRVVFPNFIATAKQFLLEKKP
jgi:hypothetical protein